MIEPDPLLGLDIGAFGAKAALVGRAGKILAQEQVGHDCGYLQPGWVEQDMQRAWWEDPARVLRALMARSGITADRVATVCVSGLYPAMGPTDARGNPLGGAIQCSDHRAIAEGDWAGRGHTRAGWAA
jgi:sugar (pentulose or hexulose) kinase